MTFKVSDGRHIVVRIIIPTPSMYHVHTGMLQMKLSTRRTRRWNTTNHLKHCRTQCWLHGNFVPQDESKEYLDPSGNLARTIVSTVQILWKA